MSTVAEAVVLPSTRHEAWKYTPVDELAAALRSAVRAVPTPLTSAEVDNLAGDLGCPRVVYVNGVYAADLSDHVLPKGLHHHRPLAGTSAFVVEAGVKITTPIHLVHVSAPGGVRSLSQPRTSIDAGEGSDVAAIETYCGRPGLGFTDATTTLHVGPGARLAHIRVQSESPEALHVGRTIVTQAETSETELTSVMVGADIARCETDVRLVGADARVDVNGLYLPSRRQRHDNVVTVDHAASRGMSTQRFKGVIDHHARGSFSGHVTVRAGTVGNDAQQTNRSLLLTPTAEADSRPWLEILADDVRCTHGATVGRLDQDALFYLRSRGIPLVDSRAMLVAGFVAEIIDTIAPASLRTRLARTCARGTAEVPR